MSSEIPKGWTSYQLSEISKISMGETILSKDLTGTGVPVFSSSTEDGPWGYTELNRKTLKRGTIVVGARGSIGFPRLPSFEIFTSTQTTIAVEPESSLVDSTFLHAVLCAADVKSLATKQAVPMLTIGMLAPLPILLPPLDEQKRIARVLQSLEDAMAANNRAIELCRKTVHHLATDVAARATDTASIGSVWAIVTGRTPSPSDTQLWNGNLPFVTPGDISDGDVSVRGSTRTLNAAAPHGGRMIPAGSLLVTCIGSTVGKMAITRRDAITNQQINAVCCPPDVSGYAYIACLSILEKIVSNAGRQAIPIINKKTFSSLQIPLLSFREMNELNKSVLAIDEQIISAREAIDQHQAVRLRVSTDLLTGYVRVPA